MVISTASSSGITSKATATSVATSRVVEKAANDEREEGNIEGNTDGMAEGCTEGRSEGCVEGGSLGEAVIVVDNTVGAFVSSTVVLGACDGFVVASLTTPTGAVVGTAVDPGTVGTAVVSFEMAGA